SGQVQPGRLIVACHPGNALNEPWQLAVRDRVLPHNLQTLSDVDTFQLAHSLSGGLRLGTPHQPRSISGQCGGFGLFWGLEVANFRPMRTRRPVRGQSVETTSPEGRPAAAN